jgi:hypothetical protein
MMNNSEDAYKALWGSVLLLALEDLKRVRLVKARERAVYGMTPDSYTAAEFLFSGKADDRIGYSGFNADSVRSKMLDKIAETGSKWRAARLTLQAYIDAGLPIADDCLEKYHRLFPKTRITS